MNTKDQQKKFCICCRLADTTITAWCHQNRVKRSHIYEIWDGLRASRRISTLMDNFIAKTLSQHGVTFRRRAA